MDSLIKLYTSYAGCEPTLCEKIAGGGSNREYYRITDSTGGTVIGAVGTSHEENDTFIYLAKHFAKMGLPVPQILAVSEDRMVYLQSDLGSTTLYDALKNGRETPEGYGTNDVTLLEQAIRLLPQIQVCGAKGLDFKQCYPQEAMNEQNVMFDLNYFKYCFLKTTGIDFNEAKLEESFIELAHNLGKESKPYFLYRDFQARNLMLDKDGTLHFIDFQGGRRGPLQYDLVSFLWQASSHFNADLKQHLIDEYIIALKEHEDFDEGAFRRSIPQWVLFRTLQVLGAYGFRGKYEQKKYFLDSIPAAIDNLREVLAEESSCPYPYLHDVLKRLVSLPEFTCMNEKKKMLPSTSVHDNKGQLKVRVFSFSYKKGIPEDKSGNGGGYVFDCRATHNPGRYEPYKKLTGLDQPVIDFLENDGEIITFLNNIYRLADAHVERYMERGFTSLMFSFGCTGGQHRSVYSAEHLADHINEKYGIEVSVIHREQGIERIMPARRKAMIFAAGLGTRLKPLTDTRPKALVEIAGKPLIEHVLYKLVSAGFNDLVVNVHHFADMIEEWGRKIVNEPYYKDKNIRITFSDERDELLETGGGILHASSLLTCNNPEHKFLVHNVDILSNLRLEELWAYSSESSDAVLVVSKRKTARYLIFDDDMKLVGWTNIQTGEVKSPFNEVYETIAKLHSNELDIEKYHLRAFAGIHYIKTKLIDSMYSWPTKFSIIDFYLKNCDSYEIKGYTFEDLKLIDVGKLHTLEDANNFARILKE